MARAKPATPRTIRCYLCGYTMVVSARTMSTTCGGCNKAIKVEDLIIKSYVPVVDLQTCGRISVTKKGRISAKRIQSGDGIDCDGTMEGCVETDGDVRLGPKATWKGKTLLGRSLHIAPGAKLVGLITVPWTRPEPVTTKKKKKTVRKKRPVRKAAIGR